MKISMDFKRQDPRFLPNWGTSPKKIRFVIIGLGGTGGYLFYYLSRLIASMPDKGNYQILIADADIVEAKNLVRQNFVMSDVGLSKVAVLAERYGNVYDMDIPYYDHYVEDTATLHDLVQNRKLCFIPNVTFLLGCVDNNYSRQLFNQFFEEYTWPLVYIDSGNDEFSGQVVVGVKGEGKIVLPPLGWYYPDVLQDKDTIAPSEESCQVKAVSSPQNISTNIFAATIVFSLVNSFCFGEGLEASCVTFNARTGLSRVTSWVDDHINKTILPYPFIVNE
jgi:molybdopterin/thiamine biosynthesis adenylyltransferase